MAWLSGEPLIDKHPFASVKAYPQGDTVPEMWILGSSNYGAQVAAHFGLPYCFAWFFTDGRGAAEAIDIYQSNYQPSERHPEPHAGLCVWALAAGSDEAAQHHFTSRAIWRIFRDRGQFTAIEPPETAAAHDLSAVESANLARQREAAFVGTKDKVAAQITDLAAGMGVQEIAVVTWTYDEDVRRESYALLADAFDMTGAAGNSIKESKYSRAAG